MPGRARRAARVAAMLLARLLASAALLALLVGAGVVGLLLHLELPVTRRVAAQALTRLLSDFFEGQVRVGHIDRLTLGRVSARDVVVRDTREREVLDVSELRIKTDLVRIGKQLWWGGPKETLIIDHIRLERAECELVPDRAGDVPSLVRALTPRPTPPRRPRAPPRHIRVWMPTVEVGKLWGRGRVGELPTLEAEVQNVRGSVLASPKGAAVDVHGFGAMVRGLGGADARGSGELHLRVPGPFWTWLNGRLGDVEVGAFVRVDGQRLAVRLELPRAEPEAVRALWPDWPLREQLRARIEATGELDALDTQAKLELGATRVSARGRGGVGAATGRVMDARAPGAGCAWRTIRALIWTSPQSISTCKQSSPTLHLRT
jgi:translocation and assembly module TamB